MRTESPDLECTERQRSNEADIGDPTSSTRSVAEYVSFGRTGCWDDWETLMRSLLGEGIVDHERRVVGGTVGWDGRASAPPQVRRGRCDAGQPAVAIAPSQSSNRVSPSWAFSPGSRLPSVSVVPK